jgi:hypothetical protein
MLLGSLISEFEDHEQRYQRDDALFLPADSQAGPRT